MSASRLHARQASDPGGNVSVVAGVSLEFKKESGNSSKYGQSKQCFDYEISTYRFHSKSVNPDEAVAMGAAILVS